jgi:Cu/Ag efflux protein CusF
MDRTLKYARLAAAIITAAICVKAADAGPFAIRRVAEHAGAAIAPAQAQQGEPGGLFNGVGVITAIDPTTGSLTLDHEEIKGLMPAMEMMYRVDPRSLSAGLRAGDKIDFAVDAKTYTIRGVKLIERAK